MQKIKFLLIFMTIVVSNNLFSFQGFDLSRIIDKDGYTNIRKGKGLNFEVIGQILIDELFYCKVEENEDWYEIKTMKGYKERNVNYYGEMYVHKSRVEKLKEVSLDEKKALLTKSFLRYKNLGNRYYDCLENYHYEDKKWLNKSDSLLFIQISDSLEYEHEIRFVPLLQETLSNYFCITKDQEVMQLFFAAIYANNGSVSESPGLALGSCYLCHPGILLKYIKDIDNIQKRQFVLMNLGFGIENVSPKLVDDFSEKTKGF